MTTMGKKRKILNGGVAINERGYFFKWGVKIENCQSTMS